MPEQQFKESPNQQFEDLHEEVESKESHPSSTMTQDKFWKASWKESSETQSPTLNTQEGKLSLQWTSFTLWKDKEELSTDLEDEWFWSFILIVIFVLWKTWN